MVIVLNGPKRTAAVVVAVLISTRRRFVENVEAAIYIILAGLVVVSFSISGR